jgi:hypothetical protein
MKIANLILFAAVTMVGGCTSAPPVDAPPWAGRYKNACLPEAIVMAQGLQREGIQARVLSIHTDEWGHAVCAYLYPPGQNRLWAWDSHWQSVPLRAWWDSPESIARAWMRWRCDETQITKSYFHNL